MKKGIRATAGIKAPFALGATIPVTTARPSRPGTIDSVPHTGTRLPTCLLNDCIPPCLHVIVAFGYLCQHRSGHGSNLHHTRLTVYYGKQKDPSLLVRFSLSLSFSLFSLSFIDAVCVRLAKPCREASLAVKQSASGRQFTAAAGCDSHIARRKLEGCTRHMPSPAQAKMNKAEIVVFLPVQKTQTT